LIIYKRSGDTFTKLANPAVFPSIQVNGCSFDNTGSYLATGAGEPNTLVIYKRSGDTFTKLADPAVMPP
jgi:hypothetical protein